nr:M48 family metallopeptidase [Desulfobulbaceae bacterium]
MNFYAIIILSALFANLVISFVAEILNLKRLGIPLPADFRDVYDAEKYAKSQRYTQSQSQFGMVTGLFDLLVMLGFWFSGGFNLLDKYIRGFGYGAIINGLLFIGALLLAKMVISLPFSLYSTFVIEERFGFNRTTPGVFVSDLLKGLALSVVLGGPLLALVLFFFDWAGTYAWFYCWVGVAVFTLLVQFIAPTWIMPLFNKFKPLDECELKQKIMKYAQSVSFSLQNVFVMDGSKRSSKSNAFFTGFGKNKRIALFDTLIEKHSVGELVAILAHEIGHYKKKHILQGMVISMVQTGVMFFLLSIFLQHAGLYEAFYMEKQSVYSGLVFFGMLLTPIEMVLSICMNMLSRKNEFEADRFAVNTSGLGPELISALKNLSVHNLSNLTPHPLYTFLHYSHPPLVLRIQEIQKTIDRQL